MTENAETWLTRLSRRSLAARLAALLFVLFVVSAFLSVIAISYGVEGFTALGIALVTCLSGGAISMVAGELMRKTMMHRLGVGMAVRMVVLLAVCLYVSQQVPHLLSAGFLIYLLAIYAAELSFETAMLVGMLQPSVKKAS